MNQDFLSNTELFFSRQINLEKNKIIIADDEFHHLAKVMRKKAGEVIFVTDGKGAIYKSEIIFLKKKEAELSIVDITNYKNKLKNITFYVPNLHNKERIRFAVEKLIELGFTDIIIYNSSRTIAKGFNKSKWDKVAVAALKQSLRAFLPNITFCEKLQNNKIENLIIFEQNVKTRLIEVLNEIDLTGSLSVLIGPEGGLSEDEINLLDPKYFLKLNDSRLRSETAVITAGAIISSFVDF